MGYYCLPSLSMALGVSYISITTCMKADITFILFISPRKTKTLLCISVEKCLKGPYVMT